VSGAAPPPATGFPGAGPASYKIDKADFEAHLQAIAAVTAPPVRAIDWLGGPRSDRPLFITFDDGGRSAYWHIAGALERLGWRGHFFVTAGCIGEPTFLSPTEIRELHARGHVMGAHSYSHPPRMGALPAERIREEWTRSTDMLAEILGTPVLTASVPGGFHTPVVADEAARAGIRALFTSDPTTRCRSVDDCVVFGRYTLRRWSAPAAAAALASGGWRSRSSQWLLYSTLTLARRLAGDRYTQLRQLFWANRSSR
jgi:peptidoglycan/xylan/chitin deacetylase (PgdA/CDA1 family)